MYQNSPKNSLNILASRPFFNYKEDVRTGSKMLIPSRISLPNPLKSLPKHLACLSKH